MFILLTGIYVLIWVTKCTFFPRMKEIRSSQHTCGFVRCGLMPTSPGIRQTTMGLIPSVYLVVMYGDPILSYITSRSDWYWVSSIQPRTECHVLSISLLLPRTQTVHSHQLFDHGRVQSVCSFFFS